MRLSSWFSYIQKWIRPNCRIYYYFNNKIKTFGCRTWPMMTAKHEEEENEKNINGMHDVRAAALTPSSWALNLLGIDCIQICISCVCYDYYHSHYGHSFRLRRRHVIRNTYTDVCIQLIQNGQTLRPHANSWIYEDMMRLVQIFFPEINLVSNKTREKKWNE